MAEGRLRRSGETTQGADRQAFDLFCPYRLVGANPEYMSWTPERTLAAVVPELPW